MSASNYQYLVIYYQCMKAILYPGCKFNTSKTRRINASAFIKFFSAALAHIELHIGIDRNRWSTLCFQLTFFFYIESNKQNDFKHI